MNLNELFPLWAGMLLGILLHVVPRSIRYVVGFVLAVAVGFTASTISGEIHVSWLHVPFDILLTTISAVAGHLGASLVLRLRGSGVN